MAISSARWYANPVLVCMYTSYHFLYSFILVQFLSFVYFWPVRQNGSILPAQQPNHSLPYLKLSEMDLDASWAHWAKNQAPMAKLLQENAGKVQLLRGGKGNPPFFYLQATDPGVSVRELFAQYGITHARDYFLRARQALNTIRATGRCVEETPAMVSNDPLCAGP